MSIRKEVKTEKEKLKHMSWRDRSWYVWEYYKFHMLALVLAACALWVVGTMVYRQGFTTRLSMIIINDRSGGMSSTDRLEEGLRKALLCGKKDLIEINGGMSVNFDENTASQMDYAGLVKITTLVASNSLDVVIGDQAVMDHYGGLDAFQNLKDYLPPELYRKAADQVYSAKDSQGVLQPVAVSLAHTAFANETGVVMKPPYLAVISNAPHKEAALSMIEYLFP